jgi:hypothetical protein
MPQTELRGDDRDVVILLLVAVRLEHLLLPGRLLQVVRTEFAFAPVLELALALLLQQVEHDLDRRIVGRSDSLPARDGEIAFRSVGQFLSRTGEASFGEESTQGCDLVG